MKPIIITLALALITTTTFAQVGIGTTTPDESAELDLTATDKGFLPPRMTTTERDNISNPAEGLTIYNITESCIDFYNGSVWINLCDDIKVGACAGEPSVFTFNSLTYKPVESAGECWLDRNLGANQVATSISDAASYGDYYQWGRASDGHEEKTSVKTETIATTEVPNAGNEWDGEFIKTPGFPYNWLNSQNDNLWQGVSGTNNPCPAGYRVPTSAEFDNERQSWSSNDVAGAFASPLKLPSAGIRSNFSGDMFGVGAVGVYWSTTVTGGYGVRELRFISSDAFIDFTSFRARGRPVRCIKD